MVSTLFYSCFVTMFLILHNILNQSIGKRTNLQRGQQSSAGYFMDHANHYLDVPEIDSKQVINMMHCLQQCIRHQRCFSTNVAINPNQNGRLTCQLLSTDKYNASMSFKRRKFFHHFSLVSPCEGAPCKHGGRCRAFYDTDEYKCDCLSDGVDRNCESKESTSTTRAISVLPSTASPVQLISAIHSIPAEPCNPSNGWIHFSGSCYKFFAPRETRQTAAEHCHSVGAHLVTIDSASEQDFISSTVLPPSKRTWLGLQRDLNSGTFIQWDDGSPVHFTDWEAGSASGYNCVVMRPHRGDYSWNDARCTLERDFVCKKGA